MAQKQFPKVDLSDLRDEEPRPRIPYPKVDLSELKNLPPLEEAQPEIPFQFQAPVQPQTQAPFRAPAQAPATVSEPFQLAPSQLGPVTPQAPDASQSVVNPPGIWERGTTPISTIGRRFAEAITSRMPEMPLGPEFGGINDVSRVPDLGAEGLINFAGSAADEMTAPFNLVPALATGGASYLAPGALRSTLGAIGRVTSMPTVIEGWRKMRNAGGLGEFGLGALETLGGFAGVKGVGAGPKITAGDVIDNLPPRISGAADDLDLDLNPPRLGGDPNLNQGIGDPELAGSTPYTLSPEMQRHDELYGKIGDNRATPVEIAEAEALNERLTRGAGARQDIATLEGMAGTQGIKAQLPRDLAGAKPRMFDKNTKTSYLPQFESDIDKAMYIVAQTSTRSKRHDDYVSFIAENTRLTPEEITVEAAKVRARVKELAAGQQVGGNFQVPQTFTGKSAPPSALIGALPDYSPTSEKVARKIFADQGITLPPNITNKELIDRARALTNSQDIPLPPKEVVNIKSAPLKVNIRLNKDGTFSPKDYPDLKLDSQGRVVGTHSGNPYQSVPIPDETKMDRVLDYLNLPRALQASYDISFPFRQGLGLIHTAGWWKSWGPMVKSLGSEKTYQGVIDSIRAHPNFRPQAIIKDGKIVRNADGTPKLGPSFAERAGLALTNGLTVREHEYMSRIADKIPGVGASNRAYEAFANKLRADVFNSMVDDYAKAGVDLTKDEVLAKQVARYVNSASGRGGLGPAEQYARGLSVALFSPRLIASRAQMLGKGGLAAIDPRTYAYTAPHVRKEYLRSMLALGSAWNTMVGLGQMAGGTTSNDLTNSDFGKIKFGETRLDPPGGFQQFVVLAARLQQLKTTSSETGKTRFFKNARTPMDPTIGSTVGQFATNKLAPLVKMAVDASFAKKGQEFDLGDQAFRSITPMLVQDILEIYNDEDASNAEFGTVPLGAVGIGSQTYGRETGDRRMFGPNFMSGYEWPPKKKAPPPSQ